MLFNPKHDNRYALIEQLRFAKAPTLDLIRRVIADECTRLPMLMRTGVTDRIEKLVETGAWTDLALALVEVERPGWTMRRLAYEDGEWHCRLSAQPNIPAPFDDTVDASHQALPLAIILALIEARGSQDAGQSTSLPTAPRRGGVLGHVMCCDNFA
jgi:hypothetical protein